MARAKGTRPRFKGKARVMTTKPIGILGLKPGEEYYRGHCKSILGYPRKGCGSSEHTQ